MDDLVDIVSRNGNLLLNVGPKVDGTIPDDQKNVLLALGNWLKVNGEAIYGTRPYKVYGEGPTKIAEGHLSEDKNKDLGAEDVRYTQQKDGQLYATIMDWPKDNKAVIHTLAKGNKLLEKVSSVSLLGYDGKLKFKQAKDGLEITLPDAPVGKYAYVSKLN